MTLADRKPFQKPKLKYSVPAGREFTDMAMSIDIGEILSEAHYQRRIGHTAARLAGIKLHREGEDNPKRIISEGYDAIYDLMYPSYATDDVDEVQRLFGTDMTLDTLRHMSEHTSSRGLGIMAHRYRTRGAYFLMTTDGLKFDEASGGIPDRFKTKKLGCPYARMDEGRDFIQFSNHIVETFAEVQRRDMPHRWLDVVNRTLSRQ